MNPARSLTAWKRLAFAMPQVFVPAPWQKQTPEQLEERGATRPQHEVSSKQLFLKICSKSNRARQQVKAEKVMLIQHYFRSRVVLGRASQKAHASSQPSLKKALQTLPRPRGEPQPLFLGSVQHTRYTNLAQTKKRFTACCSCPMR